jgi:ABC-type multidrug transport system ATPase subunit
MNPQMRQIMWALLDKHKVGRTILITTHSMDEADLLGDTIAIMTHGKIGKDAHGTSLELKAKHGVGYHLTIAKEPATRFQEGAVRQMVTETVAGAVAQDHAQHSELHFLLPRGEIEHFPALFASLESRGPQLGIETFGISCTTMEEVFLSVGKANRHRGTEKHRLNDNRILLDKKDVDGRFARFL